MSSTIRRGARIAFALSLALLLAGCLRAKQDLTLNPDDTVDGVITIAVSEQLISLSGSSSDEVLQQITEGESPVPEGADVEVSDYDEDGYVGKVYTFTGAPLSSITDQGDLSITHEGDTFVVDGNLDLSAGETPIDPNDPTTQELLSQLDVSLSVTFPGDVTDHNGSLDGTTVTWTPAFGEATSIHAVGSAVDGGSSSLMWILIGLGVVVLIVVVLIVVLRGRGKPGAEVEGEAAADAPVVPGELPPATPGDPPVMPGSPETGAPAPMAAPEPAPTAPVEPTPEPEPAPPASVPGPDPDPAPEPPAPTAPESPPAEPSSDGDTTTS